VAGVTISPPQTLPNGRRIWYIDVGDLKPRAMKKAIQKIKDAMEPKKVRVWMKPPC
jgi:hypothetical protein